MNTQIVSKTEVPSYTKKYVPVSLQNTENVLRVPNKADYLSDIIFSGQKSHNYRNAALSAKQILKEHKYSYELMTAAIGKKTNTLDNYIEKINQFRDLKDAGGTPIISSDVYISALKFISFLPSQMSTFYTFRDSIQFERDFADGYYTEIEVFSDKIGILLMNMKMDIVDLEAEYSTTETENIIKIHNEAYAKHS